GWCEHHLCGQVEGREGAARWEDRGVVSTEMGRPAASPSPSGQPRPTVLYLGGLGRSGTTVLERVLGELPGVCSVGELVHLWRRGVLDDETCGCGSAFSACPFWSEV